MQVGELFLALGLFVDDKEWNLGQAVIEQMTTAMKKLAVNAVTATTDVKKAMDGIGLPAVAAKTNLEKIAESGGHVESTFKRMAMAAAGFFALDGIKSAVMDVVEYGSKLNDTAQKTGFTVEQLQYWGYAAKQNGASMDDVTDASKKMAKGLNEALDTGKGPFVDAMTALHISMKNPAVQARNLNGIMYMMADKFSTMPDGALKTAIAMGAMGKSADVLIPTLNNGVQGLVKYKTEAENLGGILHGPATEALDGVGDNIDRLKKAWMGLKSQAVVNLLPLLAETVQHMLDWVVANKEMISQRIADVIGGVVTVIKTLGSVIAFAVHHWKILAAVIGAVTIVNGIMAVVKAIIWFQAAQTAAAVTSIVAWASILGPILLIIAACVLVGLAVWKFHDEIWAALQAIGRFFSNIGSKIESVFTVAWDAVSSAASTLWSGLKSGFSAAWDFISELPVVQQMLWLVNKMADLTGLSSAVKDATDLSHEQDAQDSMTMSPAAFAAAHPEIAEGAANNLADFDRSMGATSGMGGGANTATGGAQVNSASSVSIVIHAGSADAKQVAGLVDDKIREHDERTRRQTAASLGGY